MEVGEWVAADQYTGRIVRIANSFVFKEPVFNYSGDFPFLWDEIVIPIKYGSDRQLAVEIMSSVAHNVVDDYTTSAKTTWQSMVNKYHIVEASTEPAVTLIANDNWLQYTIRYVVDFSRRRSTKHKLFTQILDRFDQTDGRVAIASTTIHLVEMPTLNIRSVNAHENGEPVNAG
jgi:small-conductance mechanosensitive channel